MTPIADVRKGRRTCWFGPTLLVVDGRGECGDDDPETGLFFREARHLSRLSLAMSGGPLWPCAAGVTDARTAAHVYVYPELEEFGGGGTGAAGDVETRNAAGIVYRSIDVRVVHRVELDGVTLEVHVGNRAMEPVTLRAQLRLAADFADLQEVLGGARRQTATAVPAPCEQGVEIRYAHPSLQLATEVRVVEGPRFAWTGEALEADLAIAPGAVVTFRARVRCSDGEPIHDAAAREGALRHWREGMTRIHFPRDTDLDAMLRDAVADLAALPMLEGRADEWLALQAGIPAYPALFARDALTAAWQAAVLDQGRCLDAVLTRVGGLQSARRCDDTDEEPGRLPQQVRRGPLQRLGLTPYAAYYGDFAAPLMFVIALAHRFAWTGDERTLAKHWDVVERVLEWARTDGDRDGDGYLEYLTRSPQGPKNQAWKDSGDAIVDDAGRDVPAPIAACEVQGYWFAAQQLMAVLCWLRGRHGDARAYWRAAGALRERFDRDFWVERDAFYALALDADKRPVRSVSSNVGHCLAAGIVPRDRARVVVRRLLADDMFSGWGVRTLSSRHPRYDPLSYHRGSVWPVENATIALGMRRFGFDDEAATVARALVDLGRLFERGRVPECVGGYDRAEFPHPGAYPRANPLQAWNASVLPLLVHTLLGLQPVAPLATLAVDPALPPWLPEVVLRDLRLGDATATLRFHRDAAGRSHAEVLARRGTFHLVRQPPPEAITAGLAGRFAALVRGLIDE
jgi:glycogen debranching enzyme